MEWIPNNSEQEQASRQYGGVMSASDPSSVYNNMIPCMLASTSKKDNG